MAKYFLSFILITAISATCFSQTTEEKLNKVKKDPNTVENAAKADAQLIDKKNLFDSTSVKNITPKRKESGCKLKSKNKGIRKL